MNECINNNPNCRHYCKGCTYTKRRYVSDGKCYTDRNRHDPSYLIDLDYKNLPDEYFTTWDITIYRIYSDGTPIFEEVPIGERGKILDIIVRHYVKYKYVLEPENGEGEK